MDDLSTQINNTLVLYSKQITERIQEAAEKIAEEAAEKLKKTSPKRTGKYARRWEAKVAFKNANDIRMIVHNKAPTYRLTHLLEKGHQKRNGRGRVESSVHIKPVEEWANAEFRKAVKEAIEKG